MFPLPSWRAAGCMIGIVRATMLTVAAAPVCGQTAERLCPISFLQIHDSTYSTAGIAETQRGVSFTAGLNDEAGSVDPVNGAVLAVGGALLGLALVDFVGEPPRHGLSASQSTSFSGAILLFGWAGLRNRSPSPLAASAGAPASGADSTAARIP